MSDPPRGAILAIILGSGPLLTAVAAAPAFAAGQPVTAASLRTEYKQNPLGIDAQKPRLSWQLHGERFHDPSMNSFNHYAYGAIGDWTYRVMARIDVDEDRPGYKHILIQPRPGGDFTRVKAVHESAYGRVSSAWVLEGGRFTLDVEVPANTTASVRLPSVRLAAVTESGRPLAAGNGIAAFRQDGDAVVVDLGSGRYAFDSTAAP